jgi:hypothetical protein
MMLTLKRVQEILKKFASIGSKPTPESFPELIDCVIWLRFVLAVSYGLYLGPTLGAVNALFGLNLVTFLPILYCQLILVADMDAFKSIHFAGVPNALALLILTWTLGFTRHFSEQEMKFVASVVLQRVVVNHDPDEIVPDYTNSAGPTLAMQEPVLANPGAEDTEF